MPKKLLACIADMETPAQKAMRLVNPAPSGLPEGTAENVMTEPPELFLGLIPSQKFVESTCETGDCGSHRLGTIPKDSPEEP